MSAPATVSAWSRRNVLVGVASLVVWQVTVLVSGPPLALTVGLYGFVLHVVFGKAAALVPSYFERSLTPPWVGRLQLPLTLGGTALLAVGATSPEPWFDVVGATLWAAGVCTLVGGLAWSVRGNLTGRETGTGEHNADRRSLDRYANMFVPVALGTLVAGGLLRAGSELTAGGLPTVAVTHLLGAGGAGGLVVVVGLRLLPRFLVSDPPPVVARAAAPCATVGPLLLALGLAGHLPLAVGALFEAVGIGAYGLVVAVLIRRTDRFRVGFYGVAAGATSGVLAVGLGVWFALGGVRPELVVAHRRLNLLGFLGLTICGLLDQFYPPGASPVERVSDGTAALALGLMVGGLTIETGWLVLRASGTAFGAGWGTSVSVVEQTVLTLGRAVSLGGVSLQALVTGSVLAARS